MEKIMKKQEASWKYGLYFVINRLIGTHKSILGENPYSGKAKNGKKRTRLGKNVLKVVCAVLMIN